MSSAVDEALAWFRRHPEGLAFWEDCSSATTPEERYAATIVRAALAGGVPAGRDLTANDVWEAADLALRAGGKTPHYGSAADRLNGIARPSGGVGQPDTAWSRRVRCGRECSEMHTFEPGRCEAAAPADAPVSGAGGQDGEPVAGGRVRYVGPERGMGGRVGRLVQKLDAPNTWLVDFNESGKMALSTDEMQFPAECATPMHHPLTVCSVCHPTAPADRSPRSWSLPDPPSDDVTVVHVGLERFERLDDMYGWYAGGRSWTWFELLGEGTVVEGEPPAPQGDGFAGTRVRDMSCGCEGGSAPAPEPSCALCGHSPACGYAQDAGKRLCHIDDHSCYTAWTRDEKRTPEPEAAEPREASIACDAPRFERGFYRLARDLHGELFYPAGSLVMITDPHESNGEPHMYVSTPEGMEGFTLDALAAAGAVRVEER